MKCRGQIDRIVLAGFMGAGKSTVGRLLATELGWQFFDSDEEIEAAEQRSIAEIFSSDGEARFRAMETAVIRRLSTADRAVIALGGGALEATATRQQLLGPERPPDVQQPTYPDGTFLVFLDAPLELLLGRCVSQTDGPIRPLLENREDLQERYSRRLTHYRRAHLTVPTGGIAPMEAALKIIDAARISNPVLKEKVMHGPQR